ncbi:MAG TPA: hypothetical protein VGB17_15455 [Pyrinomonadaceae bacterium]|jgi:hypothetical protein
MENRSNSNQGSTSMLLKQLIHDTEVMAKYALSSGLAVPPSVIQTLEMFAAQSQQDEHETGSAEADLSISAGAGSINGAARAEVSQDALKRLVLAHERLSKIVAPATPRTLGYLDQERNKKRVGKFLGSVGLVRIIMLLAFGFLLAFILLSLSPAINDDAGGGDIYKSAGWSLLIFELFFLSAAGIGASFAALFEANSYIVKGIFDPRYRSSYWIKIAIGVIAGFILAQLIPLKASEQAIQLQKPTLAMIGGFSGTVVYRILRRLIESVESFVRGEPQDILAAQGQMAKAQAAEERNLDRLKVTALLLNLRNQLGNGDNAKHLEGKIDALLAEYLPDGVEDLEKEEIQPLVQQALTSETRQSAN